VTRRCFKPLALHVGGGAVRRFVPGHDQDTSRKSAWSRRPGVTSGLPAAVYPANASAAMFPRVEDAKARRPSADRVGRGQTDAARGAEARYATRRSPCSCMRPSGGRRPCRAFSAPV